MKLFVSGATRSCVVFDGDEDDVVKRDGNGGKLRVNGVGAILVGAIGPIGAEEVVAAASIDGGCPIAENSSLRGIDPRILMVIVNEGKGCKKIGDLYRRLAGISTATE